MQWKKYLTSMQIIQFIIDLFIVYFGSECSLRLDFVRCGTDRSSPPAYSYFTATYWPHLPNMGTCAGTEGAALFGCGLLTSYLFLFINFYIQTYRKPAGKKPVTNGKANGHSFKSE